jgi:hypothetical protein
VSATDYADVRREPRVRRSRRTLGVSALGPLTALGGLVWAFAQPHRITFLDPDGYGFWRLAVEPPLLVILVGLLFHLVITPGLLADLEEAGER